MSRPNSLASIRRISTFSSLLVIAITAPYFLSGCGSGSSTPPTSIGVSVAAFATTVNGAGTVTLTATVSNDSTNAGVTWTAPAIGSLSSLTAASTTYTAPAATNSTQSVTLTATSVADKTKSSSVTITINALKAAQVAGSVVFSNSCGPIVRPSVSLSINTSPVQTTTTDSNGAFSFAAVPQGTYTVTPSLAGSNAVFSPATQSVMVGSGGAVANFKAAVGYAVSGNVSYTGTATGPIEVILEYHCSGGGQGHTLGTEISAPGPFTINGAAPGSYTVLAWGDAAHNRWPNASDPTGSSAAFTVSSADATGVSVALADPSGIAFPATVPYLGVLPIDEGAMLSTGGLNESYSLTPAFWLALTTGQLEVATAYTVQWSSDPTFTANVQSKSFPAAGTAGPWILDGLTNGQQLYFRFQGVLGSTTSLWSPVAGPVMIGELTGPITVTGNVTFANPATGPLYLSFNNSATHQNYYARIANPVSPQAYSIQLPVEGDYSTFAFVDQNNDNILQDSGDMVQSGSVYNVAVTGNSATQNIKLVGGGNSYLGGQTQNIQSVNTMAGSGQSFGILGVALSGSKQFANLELVSGPNVVVPQDFSRCAWTPNISYCPGFSLVGNLPKVGDAYGFKLTYSDGSSETSTYAISGLPGAFGADPTPNGTGSDLTPTFSWTDPPNAGNYQYTFAASGSGLSWSIPAQGWADFSSSIDSVTWGVDPTGGSDLPSLSSLTSGNYYSWSVTATDSNNNTSELGVGYYPGYNGSYLPTANPATLGPATVGQNYSGTIAATNGTSPYTFTVTGLSDGLTASTSGGTVTISGTPLAAGTVSFQVYVVDSMGIWWGPVTYTINVGS